MPSLAETLAPPTRSRARQAAPATAPAPDEPNPAATLPPNENSEYRSACDRLDALVAERMSVEARLEAAELRALKHGSSPAIVAERALAAFLGKPIGFQAVDSLDQLREDCEVAKSAEQMGRDRRDELLREICRKIQAETAETWKDLNREAYLAFGRYIVAEERADEYLADLARKGAHHVHDRRRLSVMGAQIDRGVLCLFWDMCEHLGPDANPLAGLARPNPAPND